LFYVGFDFRVGDTCGVGFRDLWSCFYGEGPRRFLVCGKSDFSSEVRVGVGIGVTGWVIRLFVEVRVSLGVPNRGPVEGMRGGGLEPMQEHKKTSDLKNRCVLTLRD